MIIYTPSVYHWALCNLMNNNYQSAIADTAVSIAYMNHFHFITYKKGAQCEQFHSFCYKAMIVSHA